MAADLVAQAEHDPLAACLLVTDSVELLDAVDVELGKQVPATKHRARVEEALAGQSAHVLVEDLDHGLEVVDAWAAEHLEVITVDAADRARRVRNAGAVFVGAFTPVSLGDYLAGSNHVLPTGGTARFSSGLSAQSFLKRMSLVEYSAQALSQRWRRTSRRSGVPRTWWPTSRPCRFGCRGAAQQATAGEPAGPGRPASASSRTAPRSSPRRSSSTSTRIRSRRQGPWWPISLRR